MNPNPLLKKLGFSDADRLVIIHTDDIGMCQASLQAYADLWENGTISSGAIMMPCPWAAPAAEYCRLHPGVDMGVHATLTAEWDAYRWRPLSTLDPATGMVDEDGFFWRSAEETQAHGDAEAVMVELQIQVQKALAWGVDATHMDTHMGTVAHPKFIPAYIQTAMQNRLPVMVPRGDAAVYQRIGLDPETAAGFAAFTARLEEQGLPLVDNMVGMPLDKPEGQFEIAEKLLGDLPAGLTHFIIHPSTDTPELRAICPDWPSRVANYKTFMSEELKAFLKNSGLQVIGYRDLRNLMRNG
ncbi:MAG: polysaccharide deacetylase family protein [Chloroflexi bacterium]|nr:polysaccharide deacetylase family protein [Chloroflexota bacterium]